jgi:hypothetical protein
MNKKEFVKIFMETFGYTNIEVRSYKSRDYHTIWHVTAFKEDARGDINIDFRESRFELFIKNLSQMLWKFD